VHHKNLRQIRLHFVLAEAVLVAHLALEGKANNMAVTTHAVSFQQMDVI
jgi:hypothetical protein